VTYGALHLKKTKYEIIDFVQSFADASLSLKGAIKRTTLVIMKDAEWIIGLSGLLVLHEAKCALLPAFFWAPQHDRETQSVVSRNT
jgi:hypothetical protein